MYPRLIVHGGAWDWSDSVDEAKGDDLREAARRGWHILQGGGSALDAVEAAVNYLEDAPLFDAGTGSHLNAEGNVEMDALIVDGTAHNFGAVGAVKRVRYPISLARRVMQDTMHNFFVGEGADKLAAHLGMPLVANISLVTDAEREIFLKHDTSGSRDTVGAVAIDAAGNIAAATSTGGTPGKPAGRVGDSPIFGAGAYADSQFGAASATGHGEHSMRVLLSKYAVDQMAAGLSAQQAAEAAMQHIDRYFDKSMVGLIVVDARGNIGAAHTTPKLAAGWIDEQGAAQASMRGGVLLQPAQT